MTIILILWSVFCLGGSLAASEEPRAVPQNVGVGCVVWSVGVTVWVVVGMIGDVI